jgi:hypothetical protein
MERLEFFAGGGFAELGHLARLYVAPEMKSKSSSTLSFA